MSLKLFLFVVVVMGLLTSILGIAVARRSAPGSRVYAWIAALWFTGLTGWGLWLLLHRV